MGGMRYSVYQSGGSFRRIRSGSIRSGCGPAMTDAPSYRSVLSPSRQGRSGHAKRSRSDAPEIPFRLTQRRVDGSTGQGEPSGRPWPSTAGSDRTDSQSHGAPIDATPSQSVAVTQTEAWSSLLSFLVPSGQGSSSSIPELSLQTQDLPLTGALLTSPPTASGSHPEAAWVACDPRFTNPVGPSEE